MVRAPFVTATSDELDLTVFISCYNEAEVICETLDLIRSVLAELGYLYEVLVYDDCSNDRSVPTVLDYIARYHLEGVVYLVVNDRNLGPGANYFRAAERGRGRYFYKLNGGNAHPADSIKKVLALMGMADMVIPYFRTRLFDSRYNCDYRPFHRRFLCLAFASLVRMLSGYEVKYFNGGVLHLRNNVVKNRVSTSGFGYQAELICRILQDPRIDYLEVRQDDIDSSSSTTTAFRPRNVLSVLGSLWRIFRGRFSRINRLEDR
jgi:glycosyltransferase involved in cell wall biosynthesis